MSAEILKGLSELDPKNDNHWTKEGLPRVESVVFLGGADKSLTREEINAVAPLFTRANPALPNDENSDAGGAAKQPDGSNAAARPALDEEIAGFTEPVADPDQLVASLKEKYGDVFTAEDESTVRAKTAPAKDVTTGESGSPVQITDGSDKEDTRKEDVLNLGEASKVDEEGNETGVDGEGNPVAVFNPESATPSVDADGKVKDVTPSQDADGEGEIQNEPEVDYDEEQTELREQLATLNEYLSEAVEELRDAEELVKKLQNRVGDVEARLKEIDTSQGETSAQMDYIKSQQQERERRGEQLQKLQQSGIDFDAIAQLTGGSPIDKALAGRKKK